MFTCATRRVAVAAAVRRLAHTEAAAADTAATSGGTAAATLRLPVSADVVIAGAGLAGVSSAFHLARAGMKNVVVIDPNPALTGTSAMSTECYRDFWPNPAMASVLT